MKFHSLKTPMVTSVTRSIVTVTVRVNFHISPFVKKNDINTALPLNSVHNESCMKIQKGVVLR